MKMKAKHTGTRRPLNLLVLFSLYQHNCVVGWWLTAPCTMKAASNKHKHACLFRLLKYTKQRATISAANTLTDSTLYRVKFQILSYFSQRILPCCTH